MEHLPQGVRDEEGCFVYQVFDEGGSDAIAVRNARNVGDEAKTGLVFEHGELVSVDMIRHSRSKGSSNGPFLRLSDDKGWLFEKKYGEVMMKKIPVSTGLWSFVVDNVPSGIALRRHPIDRSDIFVEGKITYEPMQKIFCDRKVQNPSTGINFYRVQGTEGWVFDKRGSNYMLLHESMVDEGEFVYECSCPGNAVNIRTIPSIGDEARSDLGVKLGELVSANLIRQSPFRHGNGPFLRLSDGAGWLFENKLNVQMMEPLKLRKGKWMLEVLNDPAGIGLRRQPIDSKVMRYTDVVYSPGTIIECTRMVQASSGVKFYRVKGTVGWVFDKRNGRPMLRLLSEEFSSRTRSSFFGNSNVWTPDFVREVAEGIEGVEYLSLNDMSCVISFSKSTVNGERIRINVYYTTRTIGTALSHPSQGATQLFRRNCTVDELIEIFHNPRVHTGKGYKRRRHDPSSFDITEMPYGQELLADQEADARTALLQLDEDILALINKKKRLLGRIRDVDLGRSKVAKRMKNRIDDATQQRLARAEIRKQQKIRAEKEAQELRDRTCEVCSRVFVNWHAKQQHYNAVHVFRCEYCYKEFSNINSLNQHRNALGHW